MGPQEQRQLRRDRRHKEAKRRRRQREDRSYPKAQHRPRPEDSQQPLRPLSIGYLKNIEL